MITYTPYRIQHWIVPTSTNIAAKRNLLPLTQSQPNCSRLIHGQTGCATHPPNWTIAQSLAYLYMILHHIVLNLHHNLIPCRLYLWNNRTATVIPSSVAIWWTFRSSAGLIIKQLSTLFRHKCFQDQNKGMITKFKFFQIWGFHFFGFPEVVPGKVLAGWLSGLGSGACNQKGISHWPR